VQTLVHTDQKDGDEFHDSLLERDANNRSASDLSSERLHLEAFSETSKMIHVPSPKLGTAAWKEQRKVRRMEFRMGAFPTFFRIINPMREHSCSAKQKRKVKGTLRRTLPASNTFLYI
jgi:hypothetical protein